MLAGKTGGGHRVHERSERANPGAGLASRSHHPRDSVFPRHDRRVRQQATPVGHEHVALLDPIELRGQRHPPDRALVDAGTGGQAPQQHVGQLQGTGVGDVEAIEQAVTHQIQIGRHRKARASIARPQGLHVGGGIVRGLEGFAGRGILLQRGDQQQRWTRSGSSASARGVTRPVGEAMHVGHLQGLEQQAVGTGEIGSALAAYRSGEVRWSRAPSARHPGTRRQAH